jgi:hypothetical protein
MRLERGGTQSWPRDSLGEANGSRECAPDVRLECAMRIKTDVRQGLRIDEFTPQAWFICCNGTAC